MKTGLVISISLLLMTAPGSTQAQARELPLLVRTAPNIAVGKVRSVVSRFSAGGHTIVTEITIEVLESLKGNVGQRVTLLEPGGLVGDVLQRVSGVPSFQPDEQVLLFLEPRPAGFYRLLEGGKWALSGAEAQPLAPLKLSIRAALEGVR